MTIEDVLADLIARNAISLRSFLEARQRLVRIGIDDTASDETMFEKIIQMDDSQCARDDQSCV